MRMHVRPGPRARPFLVLAGMIFVAGCAASAAGGQARPQPVAGGGDCPWASYRPRLAPPPPPASDPAQPYFHAAPGLALADPGPGAVTNANGSPRITRPGTAVVDTAAYAAFRRTVAPLLERWSRDRRLALNPAFVAALLAKESGFHSDALSGAGALGYAQLTFAADSDLRIVSRADSLSGWMCREVRSWPRAPAFHAAPADSAAVARMLASGELSPRTEYLLDPVTATRAAVLWLRTLEVTWTGDVWPGTYGRLARDALNGGRPLSEAQLMDLVTASYNAGYDQVAALVRQYGPAWEAHLPVETRDYVERIRAYTVLFQRAR